MVVTLLASLLSSTVPNASVADFVGCYAVSEFVADGKGRSERKVESKAIRLLPDLAKNSWGKSGLRVEPASPKEKFNFKVSYWLEKDGAIEIVMSNNGLSGVRGQMHLSPGGLEGVIESYWDFQSETTNERRVVFVRKSCDSFR
jgi:hypothetical protein